ncbi:MAG: hypothetical protein EPN97_16330 [Alphaproteobacteria bacterium]|nr:MAG: hypothetical protein EPN97_16330 [Alphaproteobacteria bacterium]
MRDSSYLFEQFKNREVTDAKDDPVKTEITEIAKKNGLTVKFNKVGQSGGACVMPPANQVTINLVQGHDNKWRVWGGGF